MRTPVGYVSVSRTAATVERPRRIWGLEIWNVLPGGIGGLGVPIPIEEDVRGSE
jgi:hypothetical protein